MLRNRRRKLTLSGLAILMFTFLVLVGISTYVANQDESLEITGSEAAEANCDIVVAKDGSGQQKTIVAALNAINANQKICVKPGIYYEVIEISKPGVTVTAFDKKNRPIIDGDTDGSGNGFFENPSTNTIDIGGGRSFTYDQLVSITNKDIEFSYFVVRNSRGDDLSIHSTTNQLTNIHVHNNLLQDAMVVNLGIYGKPGGHGSTAGTVIENNIMENASQYPRYGGTNWPGAVCMGGANDFVFRGNIVRYAWGDGILTDCNWKKSDNVIIEGNLLYDTKVGLMYVHAATNITVRNNFIFSTPSNPTRDSANWACILFQGQENESYRRSGVYGVSGAKIYNNITWGCRISLGVHSQAPSSYVRDVDIYNNTFVNSGQAGSKNVDAGAIFADINVQTQFDGQKGKAENVRIRNNIFAHTNSSGQVPLTTSGSNQGLFFSNNYWSKKPTGVDVSKDFGNGDVMLKGKTGKGDFPVFDTPPTIDQIKDAMTWFQLRDGSPAINKALSGYNLAIDYNGFKRDTPNDIGAMELGTKPIDGWNYVDDPGPKAICGNGQVESGEQCDDGNKEDNDDCRNDCTLKNPGGKCGDGNIDPGEECDDGNQVDSDGCTNECKIAKSAGKCGDGNIDPGEECDDGNQVDTDLCSNVCKSRSIPGPSKSTDLNKDEIVDILDISLMLSKWGEEVPEDAKEDLNNDGVIDILDVSLLLQEWGK